MAQSKTPYTFPKEIREYYKDAYEKNSSGWLTLLEFVKQERERIMNIVSPLLPTDGSKIDWVDIAKKLREKWDIPKYFPLSTLQKLVQHSADGSIDLESEVFNFPENSLLQNPQVLENAIPKTDHLISSQSDQKYGFVAEWLSNAIDASNSEKQIGRFGEWFFQSLSQLSDGKSEIEISSKTDTKPWYKVSLQSRKWDIMLASEKHEQENSGTTIHLQKSFSKEDECKEIQDFVTRKFRTNTRARIICNGKRLNTISSYHYLNGEAFSEDGLPEVHIDISPEWIKVTDMGIGMSADGISKNLLYPNTTSKERKKMTDTEVTKLSPDETRFFYKNKRWKQKKTHILLQVAGVVIEDFHVESVGSIGECVFEFPSFSPLEDSRNEIKVWRETTISLVSALEKIANTSSDTKEKLALLEVVSSIYLHLRDRPSNIVDEAFTLTSNMKKSFGKIQSDIESSGITVLPGDPKIVDAFGLRDDVFYIAPEFVDFVPENIPKVQEITESIESPAKYNHIKNYRFFEAPFDKNATHDYLVFEWTVYINKHLLKGKLWKKQDDIIHALNTSINLNTSYELENEKVHYGRVPSSSEGEIIRSTPKRKQKHTDTTFSTKFTSSQVLQGASSLQKELSRDEQELLIQEQVEFLMDWYEGFYNKYSHKTQDHFYDAFNNQEDVRSTIKWRIKEGMSVEETMIHIQACVFISYHSNVYKGKATEELVWIIQDFVETKNSSLVIPTMEFIREMYAYLDINQKPGDIELSLRYTKTLLKILNTEPQFILEIMERFKGDARSGFKIFKEIIDAKVESGNKKVSEPKKRKHTTLDMFPLRELEWDDYDGMLMLINACMNYREKIPELERQILNNEFVDFREFFQDNRTFLSFRESIIHFRACELLKDFFLKEAAEERTSTKENPYSNTTYSFPNNIDEIATKMFHHDVFTKEMNVKISKLLMFIETLGQTYTPEKLASIRKQSLNTDTLASEEQLLEVIDDEFIREGLIMRWDVVWVLRGLKRLFEEEENTKKKTSEEKIEKEWQSYVEHSSLVNLKKIHVFQQKYNQTPVWDLQAELINVNEVLLKSIIPELRKKIIIYQMIISKQFNSWPLKRYEYLYKECFAKHWKEWELKHISQRIKGDISESIKSLCNFETSKEYPFSWAEFWEFFETEYLMFQWPDTTLIDYATTLDYTEIIEQYTVSESSEDADNIPQKQEWWDYYKNSFLSPDNIAKLERYLQDLKWKFPDPRVSDDGAIERKINEILRESSQKEKILELRHLCVTLERIEFLEIWEEYKATLEEKAKHLLISIFWNINIDVRDFTSYLEYEEHYCESSEYTIEVQNSIKAWNIQEVVNLYGKVDTLLDVSNSWNEYYQNSFLHPHYQGIQEIQGTSEWINKGEEETGGVHVPIGQLRDIISKSWASHEQILLFRDVSLRESILKEDELSFDISDIYTLQFESVLEFFQQLDTTGGEFHYYDIIEYFKKEDELCNHSLQIKEISDDISFLGHDICIEETDKRIKELLSEPDPLWDEYYENSFLDSENEEKTKLFFTYVKKQLMPRNERGRFDDPEIYRKRFKKQFWYSFSINREFYRHFDIVKDVLEQRHLSGQDIQDLKNKYKELSILYEERTSLPWDYTSIREVIKFQQENKNIQKRISSLVNEIQDIIKKTKNDILIQDSNIIKRYFEAEKSVLPPKPKENKETSTHLGKLPENFFESLSKKYQEDIIAFTQFLESDGDFLAPKDSVVQIQEPDLQTSLSQVIHTSMKYNSDISPITSVERFRELVWSNPKKGTHYNDIISGVCIAQDEVSMYYLREWVQNARDALLRANKEEWGTIHIDTYSRDGHFTTSISDSVWMELSDVIVKLLTPYNSGKDGDIDATGKFGKWFFTFAIGAKELRIKTSTGNGTTQYLKMTPDVKDGIIHDFEVQIESRKEQFKGTTIERVDELSGIQWNLRALIGTNLLKKYVGNVEWVSILYNNQLLNTPSKKQLLATQDVYENFPEEQNKKETGVKISEISEYYGTFKWIIIKKILQDTYPEIQESDTLIFDNEWLPQIVWSNKIQSWPSKTLGTLNIYRSEDSMERFTKDNLWISEIKQDLISDFPDWIQEYIKSQKISIDIPSSIPLVGSRNSIENKEYYINILKTPLYRMVIDMILSDHVKWFLKIPMMPEDYLTLLEYERRGSEEVSTIAVRYNSWNPYPFSQSEIDTLKDTANMAHFLSLAEFSHSGKKTSLRKIKEKIHNDNLDNMENFWNRFQSRIYQAQNMKEGINSIPEKHNLTYKEVQEITWLSKHKIKKLENFIQSYFSEIIEKSYGWNFNITFHRNEKWSEIASSYGSGGYGLSFRVDWFGFKNLVENMESPETQESIIGTVAHEMTHNEEDKLGTRKWGTHETDELHDESFMKINRDILTQLTRSFS